MHPKWYQRRTLDAAKTHIEGALADGFHHIVALRPQAKEKCAKLCEVSRESAVGAKKLKTSNEKCTNIHKNGPQIN